MTFHPPINLFRRHQFIPDAELKGLFARLLHSPLLVLVNNDLHLFLPNVFTYIPLPDLNVILTFSTIS